MDYRIDTGRVGISQRTHDGFLRCYMRLAAADRPYTYRNSLGGQRQEIVPPDSLFKKDSTDTFKMLPLTLQHPASRIVTPSNASQLMKGSTGHTVVREKTTDGEFLGIVASVFDRGTIDAIDAGWQISPGYRVKTRARNDGIFEQHGRSGNHVAVVPRARGGPDILPVLSGIDINIDADDEADGFWYSIDADEDSPIYRARFDEDMILPLMAGAANRDDVAQRTPVDLSRYKVSPQTKATAPTTAEAKEKKPEPSPDLSSGLPQQDGCESCEGKGDCDCASCSRKQKGKSKKSKKTMASLQIGDVTYNDVDAALAQAVAPLIERSDALDEVLDLNSQLADALKESRETLDSSTERIDELVEELQAAEESNTFAQLDSDDSLQINIDAVELVSSIRQDAALVLSIPDLNLDSETREALSNLDARAVLENLDDVQQVLITAVNPAMAEVLENMDGDGVTAAYDASMAMFRSQVANRSDAADGSGTRADGGDYSMSTARIPGMGARGGKKGTSFRHALKAFHAQQDEAFKTSGEALGKSTQKMILL